MWIGEMLWLQHFVFLRLVGFVAISTYWFFMDICTIKKIFCFCGLFFVKKVRKRVFLMVYK
jgi:hypothetical protein